MLPYSRLMIHTEDIFGEDTKKISFALLFSWKSSFSCKISGILNKCLLLVMEAAPPTLGGGTSGTRRRHLRPLEVPPMPLGDSSFTPMGMSCVTHRRYRSTPITDIGVRDARHLRQMEALVGRKVGFSRNENRLQSVTECPSVGNWFYEEFSKNI